MAELSGIRAHVFIGGVEVLRTPGVWVESARHRPVGRAGVTLPDPDGAVFRSVAKGDAVEIRMGYRDETPAVWQGAVAWRRRGATGDQVEIGAVGPDVPLSTVRIVQAWSDEAPEAIVRWAVQRTGLPAGRIDSPGCTLPRFVASDIPVWQVARQCAQSCDRGFGIDMRAWALWMGADGAVNWGDFDEPGEVPVIATADMLIAHTPAEDATSLHRVETFLLPGLRHSQVFRLRDRRRGIDALFRALLVRHELMETRARTYISYGDEFEKY